MKTTLTLLFFVLMMRAQAQVIAGKLIDKNTGLPLRYILVGTKTVNAFTDEQGGFKLRAKFGDTVKIRSMGYKPFTAPVNTWGSITKFIMLEPTYVQLTEVKVTAQKNHHKDSVNLRQEYAKQFNFRGPRFNEIFLAPSQYVPFAIMSINVTMLYKALTKKRDHNYKLQQTLLREEQESHISARFNKTLIAEVTHLQGDSLDNFASSYRPTAAALDKLTDYDLMRYIKTNLQKFKANATVLDELPVLLKPGQSLE